MGGWEFQETTVISDPLVLPGPKEKRENLESTALKETKDIE